MAANPSATPQQPNPKEPKAQPPDAGHIPITEEMDSARWTLPPLVPLLVGLIAVAIVVAIFSFTSRDIVAKGAITGATAVDLPQGNAALVAIRLHVNNSSDKTLLIKTLSAKVSTAHGDFTDTAAAADDVPRYLEGYPQLAQPAAEPLHEDQQIAPHAQVDGVFVVSYPISKQEFDTRKSLDVSLVFYDHRPLELHK